MDITRQSDVYDKIAPSIGVAENQKRLQQKREEAEKLREALLAKQREDEEKGINQHLTHLPLELLYKQKMEKKIKEQMQLTG